MVSELGRGLQVGITACNMVADVIGAFALQQGALRLSPLRIRLINTS